MAELSVFYFMFWQEVQFLTGCPSSHKCWKEVFFFIRPTNPFDIPTTWIYALSVWPLLARYKDREDYKIIVLVLGGKVFDLGHLIREGVLSPIGLIPTSLDLEISMGRSLLSFIAQ